MIGGVGSPSYPRLLARGRDADVFALNDTSVIRRYRRDTPKIRDEVAVMRFAREHGYPVPDVRSVDGREMVLERINGPTMADDGLRKPWRLLRHAEVLARLHASLHVIPAPEWLRGEGDTLVHLDLHPRNVLISSTGPVVIDWSNARRGRAIDDVALTFVILAQEGGVVRWFAHRFAAHFERASLEAALPGAIERRLTDPNMSPRERVQIAQVRL